ncbi:pentapeptide repeat-containing protein [Nocardia sp. NPDC050713]|uniref:pentapeptide repeat-containing protein n=1 Tax=Nocardia sp. NPDC050713 TaxID=3154511 RepID=UPI0033C5AF62
MIVVRLGIFRTDYWVVGPDIAQNRAVLEWVAKRNKAISRFAGRIRLFPAVAVALLAGLGVAFAAYGFLHWITPVDASKKAAEIDVTRIALTVVAGVGGVVALVIAYRRQRDLEQSRFVERFGAAAAQLGATDVAVRIAGVYAMAGVADESDGLRRQQCIDVLCGYLRLPYSPELGGNHQTKDIRKHRAVDLAGPESEQHFEYRQNDREVRATIVRVIAEHLRPPAEYSWTASHFDFRTAHLEDVDLSDVEFSGAAWFDGATFSGDARFYLTRFSGDARFEGATFSGDARFDVAHFSSHAWFEGATFSLYARFDDAHFPETPRFDRATFSGDARFDRATFSLYARFDDARFSGTARFDRASFSGTARFDRATFTSDTRFVEVNFGTETISFVGPNQWGPPAPVFDWDRDVSQKPANVEPQHWPPVVAAAS